MNTDINPMLFSTTERMELQTILTHHRTQAAKVPWLVLVGALAVTFAACAMLVEWEMLYQVFDYLAGEAGYWSPALMACGALVVILGYHLLARSQPQHLAVRLIKLLVSVLIPLYLIGAGLLIASILYADGLGEMAAPGEPIVFGQIAAAASDALAGSWIEQAFGEWTNPLAVLVFALGIGGLSISNVFVTHEMLSHAEAHFREAATLRRRARAARADYAAMTSTHERFAQVSRQLIELNSRWDEAGIREAITAQVISTIAQSLQPHKAWLRAQGLHAASRFKQGEATAPKSVAEAVATIEAVSWDQVMAALHPHLREDFQ